MINTVGGAGPSLRVYGAGNPGGGEPPPQMPQDDFQPGAIRQAYDTAARWVGGAVGAALSVPAGALTGACVGLARSMSQEDVKGEDVAPIHATLQVATDGVMTLLATGPVSSLGGAVAGSAGSIVAGASTLGVGAGLTYLHNSQENSTKVGDKICQVVNPAVARAPKSDSAIRDGFRAVTVGTLYGAGAGMAQAAEITGQQGLGLAEGLLEGSKEGAKALTGQYDLPSLDQPDEPAGWGRKTAHALFGTAGAVLGSAFSAVDGALQGGLAASVPGYSVNADLHRTLMQGQTGLASVVGLGMALGPLGVVGGLVAGGYLAHAVGRIEKSTGIDVAITSNVANAVDLSLQQSPNLGTVQANQFRDSVQGTLVGAAAGARNGARFGYEGGKGAADGVIDVASGVVDALDGVYEAIKEVITGGDK